MKLTGINLSICLVGILSACSLFNSEKAAISKSDGISGESPLLETKDLKSTDEVNWTMVGVGEGGSCQFISVQPQNPDYMLFFNDMGGSYWSDDGGKSYHLVKDSNGEIDYIPKSALDTAFAPSDPNMVYTATPYGIYKSTDMGKTWDSVSKNLEFDGVKLGTGAFGRITSVAVNPQKPDEVLAGLGDRWVWTWHWRPWGSGLIIKTNNGGKTWKKVSRGLHPKAAVFSIKYNPENPKEVYTATDYGFFKSSDGGETWKKSSKGLPHDWCVLVRTSKDKTSGKTVLYLLMATRILEHDGKFSQEGGLWKSTDDGETWTECNGDLHFAQKDFRKVWNAYYKYTNDHNNSPHKKFQPVPYDKLQSGLQDFWCLEVDPQNSDIIYIGTKKYHHTPGPCGVYKSVNGGKTWKFLYQFPAATGYLIQSRINAYKGSNVERSWVEGKFNTGPYAPRAMCLAPTNSNILYTANVYTTYKTCDGGKSWADNSTDKLRENLWKGRGNSNVAAVEVNFSPFSKTIILAAKDIALWVTEDSGKTLSFSEGITEDFMTTAFDPEIKGKAYTAGGKNNDFFISENEGRTWKRKSGKIFSKTEINHIYTKIVSIIIDPDSPRDSRRIYVSASSGWRGLFTGDGANQKGSGIKVSEDGGKTWKKINHGLPNGNVNKLIMHPRDSKTLFACLLKARKTWTMTEEEKKNLKEIPGGLYVSHDRGENWKRLSPEWMENIPCLDINPSNPNIMYLTNTIVNTKDPKHPDKAGVYKSTDGGKTWKRVLSGKFCNTVKSSPVNLDIVFASRRYFCGHQKRNAGAFLSEDGGKTWVKANKGLPLLDITSFSFNPHNPNEVWCGTWGCGWNKTLIDQ